MAISVLARPLHALVQPHKAGAPPIKKPFGPVPGAKPADLPAETPAQPIVEKGVAPAVAAPIPTPTKQAEASPSIHTTVVPLVPGDDASTPVSAIDFRALAKLIENQLEIRDAQTNAPLIAKRGMPLIEGLDPAITLSLTLREAADGADLVYEFTNTAAQTKPLGTITVGVITIGPGATYSDFRRTSDVVPTDPNTFAGKAWSYPGETYCPAMVLSSPTATVGISLQYPVLEYAHDVRMSLVSPPGPMASGEGGRGWAVRFQLGSTRQQAMKYEGKLRPKETRTYTVAIRAIKARDQWMRTLLPYREYFQTTYGGVHYSRAKSAVLALPVAEDSQITDDNPLGWSQFRPDLWGFSKLSRALRTNYSGWRSVMLFNPSGVFKTHRDLNPPFQFASTWAGNPLLASATEPRTGLPSVAATGKHVGLWWGNAARVMSEWDPAGSADFDPDKADHVKAALAELDAAVQTGASIVTLGNFVHERTPVWKQYQWVMDLSSRYPSLKFVIEPAACDLMHTISPSVVNGVAEIVRPARDAELYAVTHPNYIADFLNPGHETWAMFNYRAMKQFFNTEPDEARIISDMQAYAGYGYVPCFFVQPNIDTPITPALSWKSTVPSDLQTPEAPTKTAHISRSLVTATPTATPLKPAPNTATPTAAQTGTQAEAQDLSQAATLRSALRRFKGVIVRRATERDAHEAAEELDEHETELLIEDALRRARTMSASAATKSAKLRPTRVTTADKPEKTETDDKPK